MKSSKDMELIYEYLIDNDSIPTKILNEMSYNSKAINDLIENKTLNRIARGHYQLVGIDKLYSYGRHLVSKKEFTKADKCFNKCYEIDPKNSDVCFQLFMRAVISMKYEETFKYLDGFYGKNDFDFKDANYYLYLLSYVTPLPEKYKDNVSNLKYEDIKVRSDDKRFKDVIIQNKIRISAYNCQFPYAYSKLKKTEIINGRVEVSNVIAKYLLIQVMQIEARSKDALLGYINNKDYQGIIDFLAAKTELHSLNMIDEYSLKLAKKIVKIVGEQIVTDQVHERASTIFGSIDVDNYQLALDYCNSYNLENNIDNSKSVIYCLLGDIVELINNIKKREQEALKNKESMIDEVETIKEQVYTLELYKIDTETVIQYLTSNDYSTTIALLREYLTSINKTQYEFLIHDLIMISLCEGDLEFASPITALTYISNGEIEFDISYFLQAFYENLSANDFEKARIYLDIISNINNLGRSNICTSNLEKALVMSERALDEKQDYEITKMYSQATYESKNIQIVINVPEEIKTPVEEDLSSTNNDVIKEQENTKSINIEKLKLVKDMNAESIRKYVSETVSKIIENEDLIILNTMSSDARKIVYDITAEMSDIIGFSIGDEPNRRVVLRYKNPAKEFIDFKQILADYRADIVNENYIEGINKMKKILANVKTIKSFVFYNLGFCYSKIHDKKSAIKYLTVYQELEKKCKDDGKDVSDFIAVLKGDVDKDNYKPFVRMYVNEFENAPSDKSYIDHIEDIKEMVLYSGVKIEDACKKNDVEDEKIPLVKLIIAKELYSLGKESIADKIVKDVEKEKNKNAAVKHMLDEITRSKKFYKNRTDIENAPRLVLSK